MPLDHEAIYKAYAGTVVSIDDSAGAFDKDGKSVTLEQSKIDAARTTLNAEAAAILYQKQRTGEAVTEEPVYPSFGDQFDLLWHAIDADDDLIKKFPDFHAAILAVKEKYPRTK